jgi:C4-dicarboxylate transporter DctM subunit
MTAIAGFLVLFALAFAGVPLAFSLTAVGFAGFAYIVDIEPAFHMAGQVVHSAALSYTFSVLPMFILMGNFVARSRLADDLFVAAEAFVGHRPGGLARATVLACGGLAAVCGSSIATAATMVNVALPAMRKRGYDDGLAGGAIAIGGTLGILIPPSAVLLLYGIITQTDVIRLFAAGIVPGILAVTLHNLAIRVIVRLNPALGPAGPRVAWPERWVALGRVWGIIALFVLVMAGILGGAFTATEGGAIGAFGAFLFALLRKTMNRKILLEVLIETGLTSAMIFAIVFGALIFANFVEVSGLPTQLGQWLSQLAWPPYAVMIAILLLYILLGCLLESVSMIFLTVPLFFPLVMQLGYDRVWFGIILVIVIELGLIHPPLGMNLFVIKAMVPNMRMSTMVWGVLPFVGTLMLLLALVFAFPQLALWLPRVLMQ